MQTPYHFPLFVDLRGKKLVVVGGGTIARRRMDSLLPFGGDLVVIAPELTGSADGLTWLARPYVPGDLEGAFLAVAATDDRAVNRQVGEEANRLGIPVSVCDRKEECTFFFPALCAGDGVIAGVVSRGADHHLTARAAKAIRKTLEELE
jgi:siroheme synthase-like protein